MHEGVYQLVAPGGEGWGRGTRRRREEEARRILFCRFTPNPSKVLRQASTGTQKSDSTVHTTVTTLTTIPETGEEGAMVGRERSREKAREWEKARQWMFEGKVRRADSWRMLSNFGQVQGSVLFRQYYPEGGWGCVVALVGVVMTTITQVPSPPAHVPRGFTCPLGSW